MESLNHLVCLVYLGYLVSLNHLYLGACGLTDILAPKTWYLMSQDCNGHFCFLESRGE